MICIGKSRLYEYTKAWAKINNKKIIFIDELPVKEKIQDKLSINCTEIWLDEIKHKRLKIWETLK